MSMILFFFFQAEDGIRDLTVTGVQTCALPIFGPLRERMRIGEANRVQTCLEPGQMLLEAERPPRIYRDHLVDTVPEYEAAVEHRNLRLLDRHELAVEMNHAASFT